MSAYLTDTVRSQGFSPSQRFAPAWTSWLCFAPHPPLGFGNGLQSFSHSASRGASRRPLLSCRFGRLRLLSSELEMGRRPCFRAPHCSLALAEPVVMFAPASPTESFDIFSVTGRAEAKPKPSERSKPLKG
jgi:hypothetical protein